MIFDYLADLITGIVFTVFFISAGFVLALNFKSLYYNDIELLKLEQTSSLDNEIIKNNYDCLVKYMQPSTKGELILPNFTLSENASKHFFEVKSIFKLIYTLAVFSGVVCLVIVIMKIRNNDHQFLFISSLIASIIPLCILVSMCTKFSEMYNKIRASLFANNTWDLSAETDPIATILPDRFFQHSAMAVFSFALICGLCLFVLWKGMKQRNA